MLSCGNLQCVCLPGVDFIRVHDIQQALHVGSSYLYIHCIADRIDPSASCVGL